jgi:uroporphyrinogen-III decarboxylase
MVEHFDEPSQSWHPRTFPVGSLEDIRLMTEVYEDVAIELDRGGLERARARAREIGDSAITTNSIDKSPLMRWVEWLAGVEAAHYLLADHPEAVEELFDAMHRVVLEKTALLAEYSAADVLYLVENTSTTLISPDQYHRYCYPQMKAYARITHTADKPLILHMCGHLKALLPDLAALEAEAFEAFTSPTLGDTTLLDGRSQCPDKCLIGGTNAVLWTRPAAEIIAQIEEDLSALPHHRGIVVTSAGVMPPLCQPETIREVCEWVKLFPAATA